MENDKFCHECHSLLEPGAKFCVHCGTKTRINKDVEYVASNQSNELLKKEYDKITESNVSIIKNKAQWTLEPGVIARRISASDFENLDNVTGINIQQGVSAYIYIDGILSAQLNGGLYNFVTNEAIDRILEQKATPGLSGHIRKTFNSVIKAITGKRVKEVIDENKEDFSSIKTYDDVIRRLQPQSTIEVYLKADSPFNVVLGTDDNINGSVGFKPISVRCKRLTANVAVSIQLTITEFSRFITNFLVSTNLVTCSDIARYMDADVRGIVMNQLRDVEIDEYGIPEDIVQRIKSMFTTHINVPGATITHIREVTSVNSDINRLREIADQLYIEEKELDYAIRSNEFQNRLAGVENAKKIQEAQTALELHKQLSEINKDNTLYEDELDSFYMLLSRQKKIKEAKSELELQKALREIAKLDLIDQYDLETLTTDLISKKVDRDAVAEIMAMQSMANIELNYNFH